MKNVYVMNKVNNLADVELKVNEHPQYKLLTYTLIGQEFVLNWITMKDQNGLEIVMPIARNTKNAPTNRYHFHMQTVENYKKNEQEKYESYYSDGKFSESLSKALRTFK